jgi:predicted MFS family arabinose efflux permease
MVTQVAERAEGISWRELWILLAGRLVFNTAFRIVYPLLTLLASGLGVTLQTASLLVTVQVAASMLSPLGGVLADARGERTAMLTGLTLLTAGTLVCALAPGFEMFLGGYVLVGLGTALFMPSVQAYASHRSAYGERGRVLGFLEMSWALAALVGVAGLTQLVDLGGSWGPAFLTIAAMGGAMLALTLTLDGRRYEAPRPAAHEGRPAGEAAKRPRIGAALLQPEVAAAMGFVVLQMFAVELIFVAYAGWLSQDFGASTTQLGLVFGLLGVAELAGSVGATLLTDRLGKRRSVLLGFLATGLLILALPSSSGSWWLFLVLFLLFGVCFEFAIVSVFPLVSGLGTGGRGAVLALAVAAASLGRVGGSLIGPRLFEGAGFGAIGITAGITALIGVAIGVALLREGKA